MHLHLNSRAISYFSSRGGCTHGVDELFAAARARRGTMFRADRECIICLECPPLFREMGGRSRVYSTALVKLRETTACPERRGGSLSLRLLFFSHLAISRICCGASASFFDSVGSRDRSNAVLWVMRALF